MKKVMVSVLAIAMSAAMLTGCGSASSKKKPAETASTAAASTEAAVSEAASEASAAVSEAAAAVSEAASEAAAVVSEAAALASSEAAEIEAVAADAAESAAEAAAVTVESVAEAPADIIAEIAEAVDSAVEAPADAIAAAATAAAAAGAALESTVEDISAAAADEANSLVEAVEEAVGAAAAEAESVIEAVEEAAGTAVEVESAVEAAAAAVESVAEAPAGSEETFVFKHGFDLDYPPYSYIDDSGKTGGFDVEMAQAVCDYYGWQYEAVPFNWDAKDAELNAGSCDCIWSGFTMNGREDDYLWSIPYSDNTQMIMVAKDSGIAALSDLAGKSVGVQTSTSAYDLLNDEEGQAELCKTFGSLEVYETYTIAFNDLKAGAIDALAIDVTSGNFLMSGETDYVYLEEELGSEQYGIGFRKDDTELCEKVNAALEALSADGTFDEIGKKYPDIYDYLILK